MAFGQSLTLLATWAHALSYSRVILLMSWLWLFLILVHSFESLDSNGLRWYCRNMIWSPEAGACQCQRTQSSSLSPVDGCDLNFFRQGEVGSLVCITAGFQVDSKWWHYVLFHHRNALYLVWYHCKCCSCFELTCNSWCTDTLGSLLEHVPEICLFNWWSFHLVKSKTSHHGNTLL